MSDERAYLWGHSDPRIAPQSLKCHSALHIAAVTDRLIYMDLIMDEAKVIAANWNADKYKRANANICELAGAIRAVRLCSFFRRIYLKKESEEQILTAGPAEGFKTHLS